MLFEPATVQIFTRSVFFEPAAVQIITCSLLFETAVLYHSNIYQDANAAGFYDPQSDDAKLGRAGIYMLSPQAPPSQLILKASKNCPGQKVIGVCVGLCPFFQSSVH